MAAQRKLALSFLQPMQHEKREHFRQQPWHAGSSSCCAQIGAGSRKRATPFLAAVIPCTSQQLGSVAPWPVRRPSAPPSGAASPSAGRPSSALCARIQERAMRADSSNTPPACAHSTRCQACDERVAPASASSSTGSGRVSSRQGASDVKVGDSSWLSQQHRPCHRGAAAERHYSATVHEQYLSRELEGAPPPGAAARGRRALDVLHLAAGFGPDQARHAARLRDAVVRVVPQEPPRPQHLLQQGPVHDHLRTPWSTCASPPVGPAWCPNGVLMLVKG